MDFLLLLGAKGRPSLLPLAVGSELGKSSASPLENRKPHGFGSDVSTFSIATSWSHCAWDGKGLLVLMTVFARRFLGNWLAIAHANPAESLAGYSLHGSAEVASAVYTNGTGLMYIYLHLSG